MKSRTRCRSAVSRTTSTWSRVMVAVAPGAFITCSTFGKRTASSASACGIKDSRRKAIASSTAPGSSSSGPSTANAAFRRASRRGSRSACSDRNGSVTLIGHLRIVDVSSPGCFHTAARDPPSGVANGVKFALVAVVVKLNPAYIPLKCSLSTDLFGVPHRRHVKPTRRRNLRHIVTAEVLE